MPLIPPLPPTFHRWFSGWIRIEPVCRSEDFAPGLAARTADPLWMLGRQWQLGELQAEDAGSAVEATVNYSTLPFTSLTMDGEITDLEYHADGVAPSPPIEVLVEREPLAWDWRVRARVGQQFETLLRAALLRAAVPAALAAEAIRALRSAHPLAGSTADPSTARYAGLLAGRVVDGLALQRALDEGHAFASPQGLAPELNLALAASLPGVIDELRSWYRRLYSQPSPGRRPPWRPATLDYKFEAEARAGTNAASFVAPSYRSGDLDWHTLDLHSPPGNLPAVDSPKLIPGRVTFAGMPYPRWWSFEDRNSHFGALDVTTSEVAKLLLMEFALVCGDDWYLVPLRFPLGTLARVRTISVTNCFGESVLVERARRVSGPALPRWATLGQSLARWEMYAPDSNSGVPGDFLLVLPTTGEREESPPIEEVRFLRDEGANAIWAVEEIVMGGLGQPLDGRDSAINGSAAQPPPASAGLSYRLANTVPDNWIAFMPHDLDGILGPGSGQRKLRLARATLLESDGGARPGPRTRLLGPRGGAASLEHLEEHTVPREGVVVRLAWQRMRWIDGETYVWLGRSVGPGRGEGQSGFRFDIVEA